MLQRRNFLSLAAGGAAAAATPSLGLAQAAGGRRGGRGRGPTPGASVTAQRSGDNACLPTDWSKVPTRTAAKTEILYKTTHGQPNGLAVTKNPNELWVLDQGADHWVTLTNIKDGSVIREFKADVVGPSGLVIDDDGVMWITSTHNSIIVACDQMTGKTIAKYVTPGAGRIYEKWEDPPARVSKQPRAYPVANRGIGPAMRNNVGNNTGSGLGPGQLKLDIEEGSGGTGAHGILSKGNMLTYACPPSRAIFTINKKTWQVHDVWPTPGNRPHGTTWNDASKTTLWNVDSNENAFYHFNAEGHITEKVTVVDDPYTVCHGAKLITEGPGAGYMYFCDDTGWLCRIKWA